MGRLYVDGADDPKGAVDEYRKLEAEVHEFGKGLKKWEGIESEEVQRLTREVKGVWSIHTI